MGVLAEFSRVFLFETNDNYYDYDEKGDDDDGKGATKQRVWDKAGLSTQEPQIPGPS